MTVQCCDFDQKVQQLLGESFNFDVLKTNPDFADIETPSFKPYANDHGGEHPSVLDIDDALSSVLDIDDADLIHTMHILALR